jgi:hypothetical protein
MRKAISDINTASLTPITPIAVAQRPDSIAPATAFKTAW